jgi:RNA recognition motif-containing protein
MHLFVGNLPSIRSDILCEILCTYFEQYGVVYTVYIPTNMKRSSPAFGLNKGHAFIMMEDAVYLYYIAAIHRPLYISYADTSDTSDTSHHLTVSLQIVASTPPSHKSDPVLLQEVRTRMQLKRKSLEFKNNE